MILRGIVILLALLLAGCGGGKTLTSIQGGESKVFERPPYAVLGKTPYDQNWIDSQIEGGVAAFGWDRPAPRPPELDAKTIKKVATSKPKKRGLLRRISGIVRSEKVWPDKTKPVAPTPEFPKAVTDPGPQHQPPPRSDVDELLDPSAPLPNFRLVR
ncbi:hypothetical protein [Bradyrhizobium cenepequi]